MLKDFSPASLLPTPSFEGKLAHVDMTDYKIKACNCSALKEFVDRHYPNSKFASAGAADIAIPTESQASTDQAPIAPAEPALEKAAKPSIPKEQQDIADEFLKNLQAKVTNPEFTKEDAERLAGLTAEALGFDPQTEEYILAEIKDLFFSSDSSENIQLAATVDTTDDSNLA